LGLAGVGQHHESANRRGIGISWVVVLDEMQLGDRRDACALRIADDDHPVARIWSVEVDRVLQVEHTLGNRVVERLAAENREELLERVHTDRRRVVGQVCERVEVALGDVGDVGGRYGLRERVVACRPRAAAQLDFAPASTLFDNARISARIGNGNSRRQTLDERFPSRTATLRRVSRALDVCRP
jgi:hypothetical protein